MKVTNMTSNKGNKIANQFIIENEIKDLHTEIYFQSYDSMIAKKVNKITSDFNRSPIMQNEEKIYLDKNFWNYSKTTSTYRNIFLNETTKETEKKIASGEYILTDLNK
tara:strand:+ start:51 stop:374 length:324 start_codon:yes stop_codon:yes gene_type:complete